MSTFGELTPSAEATCTADASVLAAAVLPPAAV